MKVRTGFVSNSSSSSFVLIGQKIDFDELIEKLSTDEDGVWEILNEHGMDFYGEGTDVVGIEIASSSEDYMQDHEISFTELKEKAEKVSSFLNVPLEDIKVLTGTRMC